MKAPSFDKVGITPKLGKGEIQVLCPYGFPLTRGHDTEGTQPSTPHGSAATQKVSRAGFGHVTLKTPGLPVEARMFTLHSNYLPDLSLQRPLLTQNKTWTFCSRVYASAPIAPHCPCLNLARPCFKKTDN